MGTPEGWPERASGTIVTRHVLPGALLGGRTVHEREIVYGHAPDICLLLLQMWTDPRDVAHAHIRLVPR